MSFSFDYYKRLKQPKMFLANPQKNYVGVISGAKNIKLSENFNTLYELEFIIYEKSNGEPTEYYNKIQKTRLIELQYIGWFQILSAKESLDYDKNVKYKTVKCYLLENTLIYKKVYNVSGTFALYNIADTEHSLLHIITAECGWNIGHVSNSLLSKWRTFDIDSMQIYNILTTEISDSFSCVFQFDSFTRTISAYSLEEIGELTDIIISSKNILREWVIDDSEDAIVTKLRVKGGDNGNGGNIDIRAVNFGLNYLINLDYFMSVEWVSQSLIDAWNSYKSALTSASTSYNTTLSSLKVKLSELNTLESELRDLESLRDAQQLAMGSYLVNGRTPIPSDNDYQLYQDAVALFNTYVTQIALKRNQIVLKENEVDTIESSLATISNGIDISNYFTNEQIEEINMFISEGNDFEDNTYIITDTMTQSEIIDMKLELMQNASEYLARISQPQFTINISASNLFTIRDDYNEAISYSEWIDKFKIGNIISIKLRDDYWIEARLMKITMDFDNLEEIELTFSNRNRLDDQLTQLAEIIADAGRAASAYSASQFGYRKASEQTSTVREFINGSLNATLNAMKSNDNQETLIDSYGFHMRKWLSDQNKYDDHQAWWNNQTLLFTDDSWVSSKTGIGLFTTPSGEKIYSVFADVIAGTLLMGESLSISNEANNVTINKDGATFTNCDITINKGVNSLKLNATDGIKLTKSGVNQFYIDANGNAVFNGTLGANAINADMINALNVVATSVKSTWVYAGSIDATQITAGTISGDRINGGTITGVNINGATITGSYEAYFRSVTVQGTSTVTEIFGGHVNCNYLTVSEINSGIPITSLNLPTIPTSTSQISPTYTSGGNIYFAGSSNNGASVDWCNGKFQTIDVSDFRLKKNIKSLDELPIELFLAIKPKQFEFKIDDYGNGINFGVLAQELENAFRLFGYNPFDYNLIELVDVRKYTDEGFYINDQVHRVNYRNFIAWNILITQKIWNKINVG